MIGHSAADRRNGAEAIVRPASSADAGTISVLAQDLQALHARAMPARFKTPTSRVFPSAQVRAIIADPRCLVLLAMFRGEPAGYVYAEISRRPETPRAFAATAVYVNHIAVAERFRRLGIGRLLLDAVRAAGREAGARELTLDVWAFNEAARRFFDSYGLAPLSERRSML